MRLRDRMALAVLAGLAVAGGAGGAVGVLLGVFSVPLVFGGVSLWRSPRPTGRRHSELPDALDFLAVCLEAGLPVTAATETVAAVSPEETRLTLQGVASHLALGRAGAEAWGSLRDDPVWGRAAADIVRSERSGTALVAVLRMHADDARRELRDEATKKARTVGVRSAVPLMVCFLPAFVLVGVVPIVAGLMTKLF
ncbi:type II secretion system F family protein [Tessaracoccus flavus]|nr:type II secretion system F family protein [Tessaracoccus flavus]